MHKGRLSIIIFALFVLAFSAFAATPPLQYHMMDEVWIGDQALDYYISILEPSGNVGIGTSSPSARLAVNGSIVVGDGNNDVPGEIRWTGTDFEGYDGSAWESLTQLSFPPIPPCADGLILVGNALGGWNCEAKPAAGDVLPVCANGKIIAFNTTGDGQWGCVDDQVGGAGSLPVCGIDQILQYNSSSEWECVAMPSGGSGGTTITNTVIFDEADRVSLYDSSSCTDGTNNVWFDVDVSAYVPGSATKVLVSTRCGENVISLRPKGTSLADDSPQTIACASGKDESSDRLSYVSLDANGVFEAHSRGVECNTRTGKIHLLGYMTEEAVGGGSGGSGSSIITCSVSYPFTGMQTLFTSGPAAVHFYGFTAADCGGTLPDATYTGTISELGIGGGIDAWYVTNAGETLADKGVSPATWPNPSNYGGPGIGFHAPAGINIHGFIRVDYIPKSGIGGGSVTPGTSDPYSFVAYASADTVLSNQEVIPMDTEEFDAYDVFDPTTYTFTAPEDGKYYFVGSTRTCQPGTSWFNLRFRVNGVIVAGVQNQGDGDIACSATSNAQLFQLSKDDVVDVILQTNGANRQMSGGREHTYLYGWKVDSAVGSGSGSALECVDFYAYSSDNVAHMTDIEPIPGYDVADLLTVVNNEEASPTVNPGPHYHTAFRAINGWKMMSCSSAGSAAGLWANGCGEATVSFGGDYSGVLCRGGTSGSSGGSGAITSTFYVETGGSCPTGWELVERNPDGQWGVATHSGWRDMNAPSDLFPIFSGTEKAYNITRDRFGVAGNYGSGDVFEAVGDVVVCSKGAVGGSSSATFTCPAGFTLVENNGYALGCMQETTEGNAPWRTAASACFTNYGARLPSLTEMYIAFTEYPSIADTSGAHAIDSADTLGPAWGSITTAAPYVQTGYATWSTPYKYKCFIPASGGSGSGTSSGTVNVYRSDWTPVAFDSAYTFNHDLGEIPDYCTVYYKPDENPNQVVLWGRTESSDGGEDNYQIIDMTKTSLTVATGTRFGWLDNTVSGNEDGSSSGEIKVICGLGGSSGVSSSLPTTCNTDQTLKWDGSAWGCADDVASGLAFGEWTQTVKRYGGGYEIARFSGMATNVYEAETDGFVLAHGAGSGSAGALFGYADGTANPSTLRMNGYSNNAGWTVSVIMPVKKGDNWKLTGVGAINGDAVTIYWLPINSSSGGSGTSGGGSCQWNSADNTDIAILDANGATGLCKFDNGGRMDYGAITRRDPSPVALCDHEAMSSTATFEYYACAGGSGTASATMTNTSSPQTINAGNTAQVTGLQQTVTLTSQQLVEVNVRLPIHHKETIGAPTYVMLKRDGQIIDQTGVAGEKPNGLQNALLFWSGELPAGTYVFSVDLQASTDGTAHLGRSDDESVDSRLHRRMTIRVG